MPRYYNIHTHQQTGDANCLTVYNVMQHFAEYPLDEYCSMGLHPWLLDDAGNDIKTLQRYATHPRVLAIGECGLDKVKGATWDTQVNYFRQQVQLANSLGKPLIIHCVRAYNEVLQLLKEEKVEVPVIFHGFNKKMQLAMQILNEGYMLSFGAALLHASVHVAAVLAVIPATHFFLETDDAAISIKEVYRIAAQIRKTEEEAIILQLEQNFKNVFGV